MSLDFFFVGVGVTHRYICRSDYRYISPFVYFLKCMFLSKNRDKKTLSNELPLHSRFSSRTILIRKNLSLSLPIHTKKKPRKKRCIDPSTSLSTYWKKILLPYPSTPPPPLYTPTPAYAHPLEPAKYTPSPPQEAHL